MVSDDGVSDGIRGCINLDFLLLLDVGKWLWRIFRPQDGRANFGDRLVLVPMLFYV